MIAINNNIGKLKRDAVVYGISDGIEQYFDKDLYFPQLEINSREEAIEFLCENEWRISCYQIKQLGDRIFEKILSEKNIDAI